MFVLVTHTQQQLTSSARVLRHFFLSSSFMLFSFTFSSEVNINCLSAENEGEKPKVCISPSPPQSNQKIVRSRFLHFELGVSFQVPNFTYTRAPTSNCKNIFCSFISSHGNNKKKTNTRGISQKKRK